MLVLLPATRTVSLLCPVAFLTSDTMLSWMYALLLLATKGILNCRKHFLKCKKRFLNCKKESPNCRWAGSSSDARPLQKASGGAGQRAEPGCPSAPPVCCPAELHAVQPWAPPCSGLSPHTHSPAQSRYQYLYHSIIVQYFIMYNLVLCIRCVR